MLTVLISIHQAVGERRTPSVTSQVVTLDDNEQYARAQVALEQSYPSKDGFTVYTTILKGPKQ